MLLTTSTVSSSIAWIGASKSLLTCITAVNQFFLSWWTAVGDAASIASDNVGEIVQLLDPLSTTDTVLDDVLIALTGVFALVPGLGYIADRIDGFTDGWAAFAQVRRCLGLFLPV